MSGLRLYPHAKINLGLKVLGPREDGYHEIRTRFQTVSFTDVLEMETAPRGVELEVEGASLPPDGSNLVMRAAAALREGRAGLPGARIRLLKSIPIASGLGGGSSDAAATLLGLDRLWELDLGPLELGRLAAGLGADVPFFLHGGTALGEGRGDRIRQLPDLRPYGICLVLPPYGSSTSDTYRRWKAPATRSSRAAPVEPPLEEDAAASESPASVHNDLQNLVLAEHPELRQVLEALYGAGASAAAISGSGSSLFGIFASASESHKFRASLDGRPFRVVECVPVSKAQYPRALGLLSGQRAGNP